ncbi:hypothetical protein A1O3_02470 [Capronia epimyces CBS 606.96]|uniref:SnoaL-like domain-containing protein n=1 Tax=Capronia epimyces CBS 606.96 TaxID=1182542 RepID=W9YA88_9EURO|nr:uncharacterized protein A1O3_02470 [Capronia epimyces CBS 606.96]EXJ89403.1 hypothetical protein A1O3_02470 [Capronia epimyces CBS 606.96]
MSQYDTTDYLLDRANIHDTVTKLATYVDMQQWDQLETQVIADPINLDYTLMFGGEVESKTAQDAVAHWKTLMEPMDATQHVVTSLLISLPPPPGSMEKVEHASAIAYFLVNITKKGTTGGENTTNGGRYEIELTKVLNTAGNPWRISTLRAVPIWYGGNTKVLFG